MKKNRRILLMTLALLLALSMLFTATASARYVQNAASGADDAVIERGVQWEELNEMTFRADDLLNAVGNDFTDYYINTLKNTNNVAKDLLNSTASTSARLKEMADELSYLISEQRNPANHARFGHYTVVFTNNGSWSDPIYIYNWSDDGGEILPWPGETMKGGYVNEFGQKQYYAFVPMDVPNIVISSDQLESNDPNVGVYTVRVQTEDISVFGNTGFYLTGQRDGKGNYKVAEWELKNPDYKQYYIVDPITPDPTTLPTEAPTAKPTETPTEIESETPTAAEPDFELGKVLVTVQTGSPRSISRARLIAINLLKDFGMESIGMIASTETTATFIVTFFEKSEEIVYRAIEALEKSADIASAKPYRGELSRYEADGFEPGRVIVSGTGYMELLKDFEIESTRLLTPGSGRSVYLIIFKEKTKEIVWKALEILENSPTIQYADPDFYFYTQEVPDEEVYQNLYKELKTPAFTPDNSAEGSRRELGELLLAVYNSFYVKAPEGMVSENYHDKVQLLETYKMTKKLYDNNASDDETYRRACDDINRWYAALIPPDVDPGFDALENHLIGDADGDGAITVMDATRIQRVLVDLDTVFRAIAERYACITGAELNILDATQIQRYLAGFVTKYAIGEHFPAAE